MKRISKLIALLLAFACLCSFGIPAMAAHENSTFTFTHYASGGITEEMTAVILFENKNSTFTKYQIAFPSCTCRDAASCYWSVMYIEILNKRDTRAEAAIRAISFGENKGELVGMWGDSNPIMGRPDYTSEYMNDNFVQVLVGKCKADFDAWEGYGFQVEGVDVDAVAGATVSTSNISSVIRALFDYHCDKYYAGKE